MPPRGDCGPGRVTSKNYPLVGPGQIFVPKICYFGSKWAGFTGQNLIRLKKKTKSHFWLAPKARPKAKKSGRTWPRAKKSCPQPIQIWAGLSWSALVRLRCNILYHNLLCNMHNDIYFNKNDMDYTDDNITTFMSFISCRLSFFYIISGSLWLVTS